MAIRYAITQGGSDSNVGTSASPWATIHYAFSATNPNRLSAGDTLYLCTSGSSSAFNLSASLTPILATTPNASLPTYFIACDDNKVPLSGDNHIIITTTNTLTNGLMFFQDATTCAFLSFNNIEFNGGGSGKASFCLQTASSDDFEACTFNRCRFTSASSHNITARMVSSMTYIWKFYLCEIDHAGEGGTGAGVDTLNVARGSYLFYGCKVHHNKGVGIEFGGQGIFIRNLVYKNLGHGIADINNAGGNCGIYDGNIFYSNTGDALNINGGSTIGYIANNITMSNSAYGFNFGALDTDRIISCLMSNNCAYNNLSGATNLFGGVLPNGGNVTSDPLFVSVVDGLEDFGLQENSPCINAGLDTLGY